MSDYAADVKEILRENGCYFVRHGKGDHDIWYSPLSDQNFPVDPRSSRATPQTAS